MTVKEFIPLLKDVFKASGFRIENDGDTAFRAFGAIYIHVLPAYSSCSIYEDRKILDEFPRVDGYICVRLCSLSKEIGPAMLFCVDGDLPHRVMVKVFERCNQFAKRDIIVV
jgi:hypothetical protein